MMSMAALLEAEERSSIRSLRRGDVIEGTIIAINRDAVVVDIGSKSEGVIPANEMHSLGAEPLRRVEIGQKVVAYVLQPETQEGDILLSLDRARGEHGWRLLQQRLEDGESFEAEVSGYNKGGLLVNVEGVAAFVPLSQLVGFRPDRNDETGSSLAQAVGKSLRLKVIELNRRRNRVILSERGALQEWRSQQKDRLLSELQEGEVRRGRISSIRNFGVFVDLGGADGLVHLNELSWDRARPPEEMFKVGDEVDVYVMKVDADTKKIALSIRRAQPEQWKAIVDKYHVNDVVAGVITKLVTFGAYARIEGPVEGLIHISELADRRINHPKEAVNVGDIVPLRVVRIEPDRHRIGLSFKQARERGEMMGFEFGPDGEVTFVPEHIREQVRSELEAVAEETGDRSILQRFDAQQSRRAASSTNGTPRPAAEKAPARQLEDEEPQTQMAAAFAALKLDEKLASDTPPEDA
ncbi:MAG TPA: S1 RNA-binding domain-containing protein [Dehalococcoidia bacterium]|nr:S1 RNA-binding domain-containing protein [Dehalococcoidia bacterium]